MKLRYRLVSIAILASSPALAQTRPQWDAAEAVSEAARQCNIPPTFVSAERRADGIVRVQVSPSVPANQADCAVNVIASFGVQVRR